MSKLRGVGIGAGYFSRFHYEAWSRIDEVSIAAICDLELEKARARAEEWDVPAVYEDAATMLEREDPDFVDVITPPATHFELVRTAADRGVHVICQKPLAPTYEEAEELVEYANGRGVRFMVHENWRFQPWYRTIKRLMGEGAIGDRLHTLYARMRTGDGWGEDAYLDRQPYFREMPRLLIFETGIHFIDTIRYLAGEVESVYAQLRRLNPVIEGEDAGVVQLNMQSGATAVYDANRYNESTYEDNRYTFGDVVVEGSGGTLRLDGEGTLTLQKLGEPIEPVDYAHEDRGFAGDCVHATETHFVDRFLAGEPFETNGSDYLRSLRVQEAVYASAEKNEVVEIENVAS